MSLESKILSLDQPTIQMDQMTIEDTETGNTGVVDISENKRRKTGDLYPFIVINNYTITADELITFTMHEIDFLPTLEFNIVIGNGIFISNHFPKDGDIVSVYIRSKRKKIKPIRMDFDILYVDGLPSKDSSGDTGIFSFSCILRVPGLYSEYCKAFKNKTSFETVRAVAKELSLGFATNMTKTVDKMTWLCAFDSYRNFIGQTAMHAYASEDSFLSTFVDKYYHLNYIDIKQQLNETDKDVEKSIEVESTKLDHMKDDTDVEVDDQTFDILLGNTPNLKKTSMFIEGYTLKGAAGQVIKDNGYRRSAQFYDMHLAADFKDRYQSHVVESPNSSPIYVSNKGRTDEKLADTQNKYTWLGTQTSNPKGNTHPNYKYSAILNYQNRRELDKLSLEVVLSQCNFNIRRGMRLPVLIINSGNIHRVTATKQSGEEEDMKMTVDRFLSGFYFVMGMTTHFIPDDGVFRMTAHLGRRDWPKPVDYDKTTDKTKK